MSDFIIIGAGSAGCILANRLSADPAINVTLIEAGGPDKHFLYRMPAGMFGLAKTGMGNWQYETTPQPGLDGRTMYVPRGKVLGGTGSINGMAYVRGNPGDFDGWTQFGNRNWTYRDCLPFFRMIENFSGGENEYRGTGGPIGITLAPLPEQMTLINRTLMEAAQQAGYLFNPDCNGIDQEGFARANANFVRHRRQSSSATYLAAAMHRPNLKVITNAFCTRILLDKGGATGVEYVRKGRHQVIPTSGEVILCGGAINSPQLLQLSGIGPAGLLVSHGVPVVEDIPGVGENLHDHIGTAVFQEITKSYSDLRQLTPLKQATALFQYLLLKSGPALSNGMEIQAFVKSHPELAFPDIQYHLISLLFEDHGRKIIPREGFTLSFNVLRPLSRGRVSIASADPSKPPLIDPNYLSAPEDIHVLRKAIRIARNLIAQHAFDDFRGDEYNPGSDARSDADLDAYIRASSFSFYHPVGSCKMGADRMSVVDDQLRVHGVDGLRVADASIMPAIVSGNTNAATMMIAERAADFILNCEWHA